MGKARVFSDGADEIGKNQTDNENFALANQQNPYNQGSTHFSGTGGTSSLSQPNKKLVSIDGALYLGNIGFNLQTAFLDVGNDTIDLFVDGNNRPLEQVSVDRIVTISAGSTADLITILGAQRSGQRLLLYNTITNTITIKNTAAATPNTILTPGTTDFILANNEIVELAYDITTTKWRIVGGGGSGATGISYPILYPKENLSPIIGATATINLSLTTGNAKQIQFPAGDIGLQIIGDPVNTVGEDVYVLFIQDSVGGRSLTSVDSAIKNGSLMDSLLDKAANAKTLFRLASLDGGVSYHAILVDLSTASGGLLSTLAIDTDKDWAGRFITNLAGIDLFANAVANPITNTSFLSFISDAAVTRGQFGRSDFFAGTDPGLVLNVPALQNFSITKDVVEKIIYDATDDELRFTATDILAAGAGRGLFNIGHLDFVDNLATPIAPLSIYSDGIDMLVNTGGGVVNLSDVGDGIFLDSTFRIQGSGDQTKQMAFEVDTFTTSTTRTFGWPDANGEVLVTPSQVDWDLNTFDIFNIDSLTFMSTIGSLGVLNVGFSSLGSGGFRSNVLDDSRHEWTQENVLQMLLLGSTTFNTTTLTVQGPTAGIIDLIKTDATQKSAFLSRDDTQLQIESGEITNLTILGTDIVHIENTGLVMQGGLDIFGVGSLVFDTFKSIQTDADKMIFVTGPDPDFFRWSQNLVTTIAELHLDHFAIGEAFYQMTSMVAPATIAVNIGQLFLDSGNSNHLTFQRTGVSIDLEGGGVSFPIRPPVTTGLPTSGNVILDLNQTTGHYFDIEELTGNIDIDIINPPSANTAQAFRINIVKGATDFTVTFNDTLLVTPIIGGENTTTLLAGDIYNGSVFNIFTMTSTAGSGGGEFLGPWTANHDAGNFTLEELNSIEFTDSGGQIIGSTITPQMEFSLNAGTFRFSLTGVPEDILDISTVGLTMRGNNDIILGNNDVTGIQALAFTDSGGQINVSGSLFNFVTTSDIPFRFTPNSTNILDIDDGGLTMLSGNIELGNGNVTGVNQIAFNVAGQTITDDINGMRFSLPDALDTYDFTIDSNLNLSIEKFFINFFNSRLEMTQEVDPASPVAGDIFVYAKLDSGIAALFYKQSDGTVVGPLGAGGATGANTALSNLITTSINQNLLPSSDNLRDLGSVSLEWKDIFIDGIAHIDVLDIDETSTFTGIATFNANVNLNEDVTLGSTSADNIIFNGDVVNSITPNVNNLYDLGAIGLEWRDLFIDGTANIDSLFVGLITSSVTFTGSLINFNSNTVNLGDNPGTDEINFLSTINTDFDPTDTNVRDMGSTSLRWNTGFFNTIQFDSSHGIDMDAEKVRLFVVGSGDTVDFADSFGGTARITYEFSNDDFSPLDNIAGLGKSGRRWVDVWAVDGTINTSFSEFKTDIEAQSDSDCMAICDQLEVIKFKWKEDSFKNMKIDKKTAKMNQVHFGYKADVLKTMLPEAITGNKGQEGVYEQAVIGVLIGSIKHLKASLDDALKKIAALEAQ